MKKRIIVALDDKMTREINKAILALLEQEKAGYWHCYQHTWLIVDPQGRTANWWRDKLKELDPRPGFLIFDVDDDSWSGFTQKKYYEWIQKNWNKESGT